MGGNGSRPNEGNKVTDQYGLAPGSHTGKQ
jgi:hypothetical protein